jgi:single-strand DNA-binding protein
MMQNNRVELAGYLTVKPELRYLPSGTKVANARLGETYRFSGTDGKLQSHTNWHSLVFYNDVADVAITYEQGENIFIVGKIQQRRYTPADGGPRTVHEIHVRSCHLIAATRFRPEEGVAEDASMRDEGITGGHQYDDGWPVSPA